MAEKDTRANLGYYHIATNPEIYEPLRPNNFQVHVLGLENLLRVGAEEGDTASIIPNASEIIKFSVVSVDIPTFSQSPIDVQYGNNKIFYAGRPEFKQGSLVINDFIGADGKSVLMAWQNLSFNIKNWSVGWAKDYKKQAYLLEFDPSGTKLIRSWKLYGVWVSGIENANYSNEDGSKKTVTASLSYDYATMEVELE